MTKDVYEIKILMNIKKVFAVHKQIVKSFYQLTAMKTG